VGTAVVVLILAIILNAAMDNAVTPRFMQSGLQLPVLVSFLSFLFWSWVFGFLGALLAIPATLFLRALLASGQQTHLLADFLSADPPAEAPTEAPPDIAIPTGVPGDSAPRG
jgi:predicted PurR-regulated permease PerM